MQQQNALNLASLEPAYTQDPYPLYAQLRQSAPVRRVILHGLTAWLVTRYEDVRQALADSRLSNDRRLASSAAREAAWLFADEPLDLWHHMLRYDPPDHARLRKLVAKVFTTRQIEALRPRVQEIADELVAEFLPNGLADLINDFAFPFPLMVIMEILGVPIEDREQLRHWSNICSSGNTEHGTLVVDALTDMRGYFINLLNRKRRQRSNIKSNTDADLFDTLITACDQERQLDETELLSTAYQTLQGGHVTTMGLIGNGMLALLRNPAHLATVRTDPVLLESVIEELLRYDGPMAMATVRFTTQEMRIGDVFIPGDGEPVILSLAAADRDPTRFADPDTLDFSRDNTGHLAFGHGTHHCLGVSLARMEAHIAFRTLLDRCTDIALAADSNELSWRHNPHLRRPEHIPVTFSPQRNLPRNSR